MPGVYSRYRRHPRRIYGPAPQRAGEGAEGASGDNESYELARQWAVEQIEKAAAEQAFASGDKITVVDMDQCDCVPTLFHTEAGSWLLESCCKVRRSLHAEYRFTQTRYAVAQTDDFITHKEL
jgi:hypothetical protein